MFVGSFVRSFANIIVGDKRLATYIFKVAYVEFSSSYGEQIVDLHTMVTAAVL